jgi:hypothetical protein
MTLRRADQPATVLRASTDDICTTSTGRYPTIFVHIRTTGKFDN